MTYFQYQCLCIASNNMYIEMKTGYVIVFRHVFYSMVFFFSFQRERLKGASNVCVRHYDVFYILKF